MSDFSKRLIQWRIRCNLTQQEVAEICNVSISTVQRWENKQRLPNFDSIYLIAEAMGVSIDWLMGRCNRWETSDYLCSKYNIA